MMIPIWLLWAVVGVSIASALYMSQAMSKKEEDGMKAGQLDGSIADEGVSFSDIAGSPHMYGNIVDIYGQRTTEIKTKAAKK